MMWFSVWFGVVIIVIGVVLRLNVVLFEMLILVLGM